MTSCRECGAVLPSSAKYCGQCGQASHVHVRAQYLLARDKREQQRRAMRALAVVYVGVLVVLVLLSLAAPDEEWGGPVAWIFAACELGVGAVGVAMIGGSALRRSLGGPATWRQCLWGVAVAPITLAVSWGYVELLRAAVGFELEPEPVTLLLIVQIAVLPALLEEWLCRGVLWAALRRLGASRAMTIVLTSVLFGMLHCAGGALEFPHRFATGLVVGWLRAVSGSLLPGIIAHFAHNMLAVLVA